MTKYFEVFLNDVKIESYSSDEYPNYLHFPNPPYVHIEIDGPASKVYGGRRILTKLEFLQLLTLTERITIKNSTDNIAKDLWDMVGLSEEISLDSELTSQGLFYLSMIGIITTERMTEILRG